MNKVIENYVLKEQVGSGQYGKVFRSSHSKTNEVFAVKAIKQEKFKNIPKLQEFTTNEVSTLKKLSNPNVIAFVEMLCTQNNVYLVYEFCNGGTLEDLIKQKKFLSEKDALVIFSQIINAFRSLFNNNILHRDLKPSNILLHDGIIKVADFGFCKTLLSPLDLTQTMVGSPIYMAPEILKGCNYNIKADIWSMGVVLFEMLFGFCPYEDKTIANLIGQIDNKTLVLPKQINAISLQVEQLLLGMLTVNPFKRIEWNALLSSPLFNNQTIPQVIQVKQAKEGNLEKVSPLPIMPVKNQLQQQQKQQITKDMQQQQQQQIRNPQNNISSPPSPISQVTLQPLSTAIQFTSVQQSDPSNMINAALTSNNYPANSSQTLKNLNNLRNRILYQIKVLFRILELNENENSPILSFLLMKSIWNQTDYLRGKIALTNNNQGDVESVHILKFSQIIQNEIDFMQNCLDSFKEEIDNLIKFNSAFSSNSQLKNELTNKQNDFNILKMAFLKYVTTAMNSNSPINTTEDSSSKLRSLQYLNEVLNCFLLEEYFDDLFDSKFKDIETPGNTVEINSATALISYKLELAQNKMKPLDKYYIYL